MGLHEKPTMQASLRQRIESTTDLPAMPEVAQALLRLKSNPDGNINDVVEIIEADPSIAAQVMRYARSAFFGYRGEIHSLHQAVTAVLGYGLTIDIAMGISLGKAFSIPNYGPMGLYPFWQHSLYSGALVERIIHIMPRQHRPIPGLGFLGGLLHNFGVLLIAHLFKKEASMLQQIILANQDTPVIELERQILGTDHMEIGAWLMRSWNLQAEIQVTVAEHHDEHYNGVHSSYAKLALLADRLLKRHDIGDAETTDLPPELLTSLGITEQQAEEQLSNVINAAQDLDLLAQQFAA
ncbi:MAG: HDOD domain-containing protein [Ectothiorhodospiraceae bacterium]|nr:HDOD domain-containing protein [Ectothiorhodospiraceae bacterium]